MKKMAFSVILVLIILCSGGRQLSALTAQEILDATGVKGGLIVHIGCGDGRLTADLREGESFLVQGLDPDTKNVEKARDHIRSLGIYGQVTVDKLDGKALPYIDNLVNLVISEDPGNISLDEIRSVLRPGGIAYLKRDVVWSENVKPWPDEIDDWTHYLHGPDNNAVAHDRAVSMPFHLQWVGEPKWARHHNYLSSVSAMVSSGGRVFAIVDEGPISSIDLPPKWFLVARDAFEPVFDGMVAAHGQLYLAMMDGKLVCMGKR